MRRRQESLPLEGGVHVTSTHAIHRGCIQLGGIGIRRQIIDRKRSRLTCLDGRDNICKVFLPSPFSDEFRDIVVSFCGDNLGFKPVSFGFGAFCTRGFELADAELGERPVIV